MKKIIAIIILVLLIGVLVLWILKAPVMSMYLSKKMKTPVSIGGIEVSKSHMKIKRLKIHNPPGFKQSTAYTCKEIFISYDWKELKNEPSVIDKIDLTDSYLYVECKNALCTKNNWTQIMAKISDKESKEADGREVMINTLAMNGLKVDIHELGLIPGGKKSVNIDNIQFNNISSKEGFPTSQLVIAIFKEAGIFDFIKGILDTHKVFDNYFKGINPLGLNDETETNDDQKDE